MAHDTDDDLLSALIDDELDPAMRETLLARLEKEANLRERLEELRAADSLVRETLDEGQLGATPQRFIDMVRADHAATASNVVALPRRPLLREAWKAPLAAGLMLALAGGGFLAGGGGRGPISAPAANTVASLAISPALAALLDETPSATTRNIDASISVTPVVSYRAADGRPCREFELTRPQDDARAVACHGPDGGWRLEVLVAAQAPAVDGYAPVEGDDHPAIAATLDRLGVSDPLTGNDEKALLRR